MPRNRFDAASARWTLIVMNCFFAPFFVLFGIAALVDLHGLNEYPEMWFLLGLAVVVAVVVNWILVSDYRRALRQDRYLARHPSMGPTRQAARFN